MARPDFNIPPLSSFLRFIFGCIIEFFGVFLITSNRMGNKHHTIDDDSDCMDNSLQYPPNDGIAPPPHFSFPPSSTEQQANNTRGSSSTTPLLSTLVNSYDHSNNRPHSHNQPGGHYTGNDNDTLGDHSTSSSTANSCRRTSSVFGGISLHSQLASKEDD